MERSRGDETNISIDQHFVIEILEEFRIDETQVGHTTIVIISVHLWVTSQPERG